MFKILKVDEPSKTVKIPDLLFTKVPFRTAIVGKSSLSGKTTLIYNLFLRPEMMKGVFKKNNIYIICPTVNLSPMYKDMIRKLKIPSENIFSKYSESKIKELVDIIKEDYIAYDNEGIKPPQVLLLFDDVGTKIRTNKKDSIIDYLAITSRHFCISLMILVQDYTQLSTAVRRNLTNMIIFNCTGAQLKLIAAEHDSVFKDHHKFIEMIKRCTEKKHKFLAINYHNDKDKRHTYCFEKFISSADDINDDE